MCTMDGLFLGGTTGGISSDSPVAVSGFCVIALSGCPLHERTGFGGRLCEEGEGVLHFKSSD